MIDWSQLVRVRERRKSIALQAMLAQRRAAEQVRAAAQAEAAERERRIAEKAAHWQAARGALADGTLRAAGLCDAAAWSGALDARIVRQAEVARRADAAAQVQEQALDERSAELRRAAGAVQKADRVREREHARALAAGESRLESATEDLVALRWAAQRRA